MILRNDKYLEVRQSTSERLNEVYGKLMLVRNFRGSLKIDHQDQVIRIMVSDALGFTFTLIFVECSSK